MKRRAVWFLAIMASAALAAGALVGCGGSASSSAAGSSTSGSTASVTTGSASGPANSTSADSTSGASASSSGSVANSSDKFVGTWKIAAAEMQGVTMGGNFGELADMDSNAGGDIVINADGTGTLSLENTPGSFTWVAEGPDSIYITPQGDEASIQQAVLVTYKDNALFMPFEQDGRQITAIFTKDGNYAGAKQITLDGAQPITSESALLGTWTLVGMNMGGISMYGEAQSMQSAMNGAISAITFKDGGVLEMDSGQGSWSVGADGAAMTMTDIMGTNFATPKPRCFSAMEWTLRRCRQGSDTPGPRTL